MKIRLLQDLAIHPRYGMTKGLVLPARRAYRSMSKTKRRLPPRAEYWWVTAPGTGTTVGVMKHEAELC